MKTTLLTIAFAVASMPMFAAHQAAGQTTPANPPASGSTATTDTNKPAPNAKKHSKKAKKSPKKDTTSTPPAK